MLRASPRSIPVNGAGSRWPLKRFFFCFLFFLYKFSKSQPGRSMEGFCAPPMSPFLPSSVWHCAEAGPFPSCLCLYASGLVLF